MIRTLLNFFNDLYKQCTFYHIVIITIQFWTALIAAVLSPFIIRHLFLPSLVELSTDLYFNFETCRPELSGVCSYPTAFLDLSTVNWELSSDVPYEVTVEITFSNSPAASKLGMFQMILESYDAFGRKKQFRRSCMLEQKSNGLVAYVLSWLNFGKKLVFLPFYLLGWLSESENQQIKVVFTDKLIDSNDYRIVSLSVEIQSRFAEVNKAVLRLKAHFGLFIGLIYKHWLLSSIIFMVLTFSSVSGVFISYWVIAVAVSKIKSANEIQQRAVLETRTQEEGDELSIDVQVVQNENRIELIQTHDKSD